MFRASFTLIIFVTCSLTYSKSDSTSLALPKNPQTNIIGAQPGKAIISIESQNAKAIHMLGTWHKTFGAVTIGYSALTILGALYFIAASDQPFEGIVFAVIGSGTLTIGLWEFNIGSNLQKYK